VIRYALLVGVLLASLASATIAQSRAISPAVVKLPRGPVTRIPSPDRRWTLVFECPKDCTERKLWLEGGTTHRRMLVHEYARSLDVSWAPDSRYFFVNDAYGSNGTECHVYESSTLKAMDVADVVEAGDPEATMYIGAGHSYLEAKRWITSQELLVQLSGHFDDPPFRAFTIKYRINIKGAVRRISISRQEQH